MVRWETKSSIAQASAAQEGEEVHIDDEDFDDWEVAGGCPALSQDDDFGEWECNPAGDSRREQGIAAVCAGCSELSYLSSALKRMQIVVLQMGATCTTPPPKRPKVDGEQDGDGDGPYAGDGPSGTSSSPSAQRTALDEKLVGDRWFS
jgi:hypothetical protein